MVDKTIKTVLLFQADSNTFESPRGMTVINESSLYRLILSSKLSIPYIWDSKMRRPATHQFEFFSTSGETKRLSTKSNTRAVKRPSVLGTLYCSTPAAGHIYNFHKSDPAILPSPLILYKAVFQPIWAVLMML